MYQLHNKTCYYLLIKNKAKNNIITSQITESYAAKKSDVRVN